MSHASPQAPGTAAAFFDVDGTLCDTRSTSALLWHRRRQSTRAGHRRWLLSLAWKAPAAWLADRVDRAIADRMVYREFRGLSEARLRDEARACCEELLLPACFPEAVAEIDAHRAAGRRVVLLSGGVEHVLRPLAEALGAELLAQRLTSEAGMLTGEHLGYEIVDGGVTTARASQGERKVAALMRYADLNGVDLQSSFAYGDSINDALMLGAVGAPVAVNPDRGLARIARGSGWQVRRWRRAPHGRSPERGS